MNIIRPKTHHLCSGPRILPTSYHLGAKKNKHALHCIPFRPHGPGPPTSPPFNLPLLSPPRPQKCPPSPPFSLPSINTPLLTPASSPLPPPRHQRKPRQLRRRHKGDSPRKHKRGRRGHEACLHVQLVRGRWGGEGVGRQRGPGRRRWRWRCEGFRFHTVLSDDDDAGILGLGRLG